MKNLEASHVRNLSESSELLSQGFSCDEYGTYLCEVSESSSCEESKELV